MIHARKDYMRFQEPALDNPELLGEGCTPIAADEPVMLFRAQDEHFVNLLMAYADMLDNDPFVDPAMPHVVREHAGRAMAWREKHGTKSPDLPK